MAIEDVLISEIGFDITKTQVRDGIDNELVAAYSEVWREHGDQPGSPFAGEPIRLVTLPDGRHCIGDGWHRCLAAKAAGRETVPAEIAEGFEREAIWIAAGANSTHGRALSNSEKRRLVDMILADPEWSKLSDQKIAKHCGVSQPLVSGIRAKRQGEPSQKKQLWAASGIGAESPRSARHADTGDCPTVHGGGCKPLSAQPKGGNSPSMTQDGPSPESRLPASSQKVTSAYAKCEPPARPADDIWRDIEANLSRAVKGADSLRLAAGGRPDAEKEYESIVEVMDEALRRIIALRDIVQAHQNERHRTGAVSVA